jgi:hypothetical protein
LLEDAERIKGEIKEIIKSKIGTSVFSKYYDPKYYVVSDENGNNMDLRNEKSLLLLGNNIVYVDDSDKSAIISFRYFRNSSFDSSGYGTVMSYIKKIDLGKSWIGQISHEEMKNMLDVTSKAANDFTKSDVWNKIFDEMRNAIQEATNTIRDAARNDDKVVLVIRKYVTTLNLIVGSLREVFEKNREVCVVLWHLVSISIFF